MSTVEGYPINPFYQGISTLKAEDRQFSGASLIEGADPQIEELDLEARPYLDELMSDLERHYASKSFRESVTHHVNHDKNADKESDSPEEEAAAKRTASNLYALCQLMTKLNEILTNLQVQSSEMYFALKGPQRQAYEEQKKSHTIKAYVTLGAGLLGGGSQIVGVGFGDIGKSVGEALGKVFPAIGNCVSTLQDGDIQGENAYEIRSIEADLNQDQTKSNNLDQTTSRFWQTLEAILRDIAQTNHTAAQG